MNVNPAPRIVNDHTMVPLRFISEVFGNEVKYEPATNTISVLPTQKNLDQRKKIKDILMHSQEVMNAKKSYSMDMVMKSTVENKMKLRSS
ncbi:copper amine oxidase N-terminal domain-containing protein [Tumebacillus flagellatus]|uniref:Copper amine oxidase-like N-terminal domain-containing protein n=1 Tax=Tumebacillus flagellatus TaxID=1157490 RepID=A0A074LPA5_9BACL|nr:hypothetical protein EL26_16280 [Tumebacillus flagellatus]